MNSSKSDCGDENSDFKTTTLRFTNNNFTNEENDVRSPRHKRILTINAELHTELNHS